jgi:hypothetical protein
MRALPAGPPSSSWVLSAVVVVGRDDAIRAKGLRCLHYAQKRTSGLAFSTSALCQFQTHALQRQQFHSTTSSAVAISEGGIVRPSVLAVSRLITSLI